MIENTLIDEFQGRGPEEEVLEPELPIIDAHHHLWDIRTTENPAVKRFEQKFYLCEEITSDINRSGHNIVQTVYAECGAYLRADGPAAMRCVGETEFAHGISAMSRSGIYGNARLCSGIFGWADLRAGAAVEPVIQAHLAASPNFRGLRTPMPRELHDSFVDAMAVLAKYNLSYDNWSPDYQRLPRLAKLARAVPDVTIIVDHLGGRIDPEAGEDTFKQWRTCVESVAACPNTVMKLGGTLMRVDEWEPAFHMHRCNQPCSSEALCELMYPYYLAAIETFGIERCMFESNFPVDRECVTYRSLWNMFKRIATKAGASDGDKQALFNGTAARTYRLAIQGNGTGHPTAAIPRSR